MPHLCLALLVCFALTNHVVDGQEIGQSVSSSGNDRTQICTQRRAAEAPSADALQANVTSSNVIEKVCNSSSQQSAQTPWAHTYVAIASFKWFFNTSLENVPVTSGPKKLPVLDPTSQDCPNTFKAILLSCVQSQGFWGGWQVINGVNYSSEYKKNHVTDDS